MIQDGWKAEEIGKDSIEARAEDLQSPHKKMGVLVRQIAPGRSSYHKREKFGAPEAGAPQTTTAFTSG